ncbi:MAG: c-type cytochrome domain-containing protein, partial [Pirellulales bacterium]
MTEAQPIEPSNELPAPAAKRSSSYAARDDHPTAEADPMNVDYVVDVQPILITHCLKCHGPDKRSSGLRLDRRGFAQRGGDSGRPILGGTPATNELLARVSSSDRTYRMPKNAAPLEPHEIELLRRWVEQGTRWPEPPDAADSTSNFNRWLSNLTTWIDRYEAEYNYALPYTIAFLALQFGLLVVIRCQTAYRNGRPWTAGRMARFCRFCDGVNTRELLLVMLLTFAGLALAVARGHVLKINRKLAQAEVSRARVESPWSATVYGWPPKPVRPDRPKQITATYYRGNCERNPELFNGGNYLTAIFRVSLCDKDRRQLEVGKPLAEGGVFLRIEIERAPGTTDPLFSKEIMASVVLVKNFYGAPNNRLTETPSKLEILEPEKRWVAFVPIGTPQDGAALRGQVYIYTGRIDNDMLEGTLHYGVQFELQFVGGKFSSESDLWMDSFGNGAFSEPQPRGKLPYREWFDDRPMPVITGENSKDPKLLGVDDYIKKGLIRPDKTKQAGEAPKTTPPPQSDEPPDR